MFFLLSALMICGCSPAAPDRHEKGERRLLFDIVPMFSSDPVKAMRHFEDGVFDITAAIDSIEILNDEAELFLMGPSGSIGAVHFADANAAQNALAEFNVGDFVTVRCAQVRKVGRDVFDLNRCDRPYHPAFTPY